jgi:hypothetical protein
VAVRAPGEAEPERVLARVTTGAPKPRPSAADARYEVLPCLTGRASATALRETSHRTTPQQPDEPAPTEGPLTLEPEGLGRITEELERALGC